MTDGRDAFLSDEDLDLRSLSFEELDRVWTAWLKQAQATNDQDRYTYSHGVFIREPDAPFPEEQAEELAVREKPARDTGDS